jgi:sulfatase maturation enzyme AslB (radical SAM superfamily)
MFEEELPKECGECNVIEASGGISDRAHQTQMKARWSPDETNRIINLDYRPSNLCNLKCRTCKPSDSSKIEAEFAMNKNLSNLFDETKGNDSEIYNTSVQKQPYDILEYEFPHLKRVVLLGGEPSIMPEAHEFLNTLVETKKNKDINLMRFYTNATNTNEKWLSLISQFNTLAVFSLDGAGKSYDYARTGASWEEVEKNFHIIKSKVSDYKIWVVCSIMILPDVENWIDWFLDKNVTWWPMMRPDNSSLNAMPDEIRLEKIDFLKSLNNTKVTTLINILESSAFDAKIYDKFKKFHDELDRVRDTCFSDTSPTHKRIWEYKE